MPHEVPFTLIEPELVVTLLEFILMPAVSSIPFNEIPVIATLPEPVAVMFEDDCR